jgi:hypothetical protein
MRIAEGHVEALARAIQAILEDLGRRQPHRFTVLDSTPGPKARVPAASSSQRSRPVRGRRAS